MQSRSASLCRRIQNFGFRILCVLHNAHLRGPQHPSVKHKPLLLRVEANAIFLIRLGRLEHGLMDIGVEFLARIAGIEALKSMLLQRANQDAVRHFDAVVQGDEVCVAVLFLEFLSGHSAKGAIEVVDGFDEVAGKALDGKVLCSLGFAFCALLQVAEVGDGAEVFVLRVCVLILGMVKILGKADIP
jgi:hypothetical protein